MRSAGSARVVSGAWFYSETMKAKPVKLIPGSGWQECPIAEATHVTLNVPGPTGELTLPVILRGTRDGTGCWTWNGSTDTPTLRPSVLTNGHYFDRADGMKTKPFRCHSWINDGHAQFLDDCSHELRGQTVALLDVECDHDWKVVDDSFDHEYGTERIVFERCELCGAEREHEPYEGPEADL